MKLSSRLTLSGFMASALDSLNLTTQVHLAHEIPEQVRQLRDGSIDPCFSVQGWDSMDAVWCVVELYDANISGGKYYVLKYVVGHDNAPFYLIVK